MNFDDLRDKLAGRIRDALELAGKADTTELQVALEDLARDTASVYLRRLAGEDVSIELAAIKARVATLRAAAVLTGVSTLTDAVWSAIGGAFQDVTDVLNKS